MLQCLTYWWKTKWKSLEAPYYVKRLKTISLKAKVLLNMWTDWLAGSVPCLYKHNNLFVWLINWLLGFAQIMCAFINVKAGGRGTRKNCLHFKLFSPYSFWWHLPSTICQHAQGTHLLLRRCVHHTPMEKKFACKNFANMLQGNNVEL